MPENKEKSTVLHAAKHFPRTHLIAACALGVCLTGMMSLFPSKDVSAKRGPIPLALSLEPTTAIESLPDINAASADYQVAPQPVVADWQTLTVKSGDNLSVLFQRAGLNNQDVYEFTNSSSEAKELRKIFPGHQLAFLIDDQGQLQQLRHIKNKLNSKLYKRTTDGFVTQLDSREPDIQVAYRESIINSSLIAAAQQPGVNMDIGLTMSLASIFGWDIDFALDIRKGDSFKVLFEEQFLDGERLGAGDILAAEFTNQGTTYRAVRYIDDDGRIQYYTPEGKSMRKDFLRAPLDFRRISSNFNPRRLHPITKTVRAHRGTDYAANRGTPVWAAGDGKVVASGYTKANGNYIVLQHSNNIQTKYLHLHKRHVKKGQRVKQKQTIGTVGSTGYSTAPHLHYEFLLDGVHRNPRTIVNKLPKAKSIDVAELANFKAQTLPIMAQLADYHQSSLLASNATTTTLN
ncbi:peptidoglycan DD-metalloendopeptidase family protein [Aurantivibrio plasticivorans]